MQDGEWDVEWVVEQRLVQVMFIVLKERLRVVNVEIEQEGEVGEVVREGDREFDVGYYDIWDMDGLFVLIQQDKGKGKLFEIELLWLLEGEEVEERDRKRELVVGSIMIMYMMGILFFMFLCQVEIKIEGLYIVEVVRYERLEVNFGVSLSFIIMILERVM